MAGIDRDEKFETAVVKAGVAFFDALQLEYAARSGDFPIDAALEFDEACRKAADTWLRWNVDEDERTAWEILEGGG